jgi:hypothetical protein
MLAAGRRRAPWGAAFVALLAVAAAMARGAAAADFFSPLAPMLSPIISKPLSDSLDTVTDVTCF